MRFFVATWLILRKELSIEFRTRELLLSTALFAVLVVVMASISFYVDVTAAEKLAPGVLWIAVTFAGVLAMGRSWNRERDQEVIRGLLAAPIPR
ncbi:MAG: heme exporter protein CcmB, partial [Myxococcota bacterium]